MENESLRDGGIQKTVQQIKKKKPKKKFKLANVSLKRLTKKMEPGIWFVITSIYKIFTFIG